MYIGIGQIYLSLESSNLQTLLHFLCWFQYTAVNIITMMKMQVQAKPMFCYSC